MAPDPAKYEPGELGSEACCACMCRGDGYSDGVEGFHEGNTVDILTHGKDGVVKFPRRHLGAAVQPGRDGNLESVSGPG